MKTIIAGSRDITDAKVVEEAIKASGFEITEVVSGGAKGVDSLGECWASDRSIPVTRYPAKWNLHGRAAGPIRNGVMAEYAEALVAIWDGESSGTLNMITQATSRGLHVYVHIARPVGSQPPGND